MSERPARRGSRRLIIGLLVLALVIAVIDQVSKYLAEDRLSPGVITPLIGDYLGLQLIYNPGAAFSLATGMTWVLTVIMVVVIVIVLRVARRLRSAAWTVALGLLLGGALGNLYDRLLRDPGFGRGHVVDFINYNGWFVGNIADIAIVSAAILIAMLALVGVEVDGTRSGGSEPGAAASAESPEEPGDEEYSAQVPRASSEGADLASWAAGAPSAAGAPGRQQDAGPVREPEQGSKSASEPAPDTAPAGEPAPDSGTFSEPEEDSGGDDAPPWRPVRTPAAEAQSAAQARPVASEPAARPEVAAEAEPGPATASDPDPRPEPARDATAEDRPAAAPQPPRTPRRPTRREIRLAEREKDG